MTLVAIVDYGAGNLHSIAKAFELFSGDSEDKEIKVTGNAEDLNKASHIVLPGVGSFSDCITALRRIPNMINNLEENVLGKKKPFLGICVGMQILAEKSSENGENKGLGWIKGRVVPIKQIKGIRIPHMGWNDIKILKNSEVFKDIEDGDDFYFIHSYHVECDDEEDVAMQVEYGELLTAAIIRSNITAVQFHPEKSNTKGLRLIKNFISV